MSELGWEVQRTQQLAFYQNSHCPLFSFFLICKRLSLDVLISVLASICVILKIILKQELSASYYVVFWLFYAFLW